MSTSSNSTLQLPAWATDKARETVERYGPGDSEIKPRLVKIIAAALAEARETGREEERQRRISADEKFNGKLIEQARAEGWDAAMERAALVVRGNLGRSQIVEQVRSLKGQAK